MRNKKRVNLSSRKSPSNPSVKNTLSPNKKMSTWNS